MYDNYSNYNRIGCECRLRAQKTTFHLGPPPEETIIRSPGAETTVVRRQSRFEVTPIADDFDSQQFATSPDPFMTPSSVVSTENEEVLSIIAS